MDANRDHLIKFMAEKFRTVPCIFAEIGVWTGTFSSRVLREVNVREVHLVDPWVYNKKLVTTSLPNHPYCLNVSFDRANSQEHLDEIHTAVVALFSSDLRVHIHRQTSIKTAIQFSDEYFDWVYIDGDHSYEEVMRDLSAWSAKIKHGGFISGDDYEWGKDVGNPVKKAVDAFIASYKDTKMLSNNNGQWLIQKV